MGAQHAAAIHGHFVAVDVTDEGAVATALQEAEDRHGVARILVNCAGIGPPAKVMGCDGSPLPLAVFSRIVTINLIGTFNVPSQFAARLHAVDCVE